MASIGQVAVTASTASSGSVSDVSGERPSGPIAIYRRAAGAHTRPDARGRYHHFPHWTNLDQVAEGVSRLRASFPTGAAAVIEAQYLLPARSQEM